MRKRLIYIVLTTLALAIAYLLPLHSARIIEVENLATHSVKIRPKVIQASYGAKEEVAPMNPPEPVKPPTSAYNGSGDPYLDWIIQKESSGNQFAVNSIGACGLFQALPCSKLGCDLSDVPCQLAWGRNYAISRYGSTYGAYLAWQRQGWW